ncbi:squalene/phytoene synthase family protein [Acetobacter nitrogenifigens]|uniref:Phytoene synthase n=2 Tax=Acetobacter nitrogenifigens TaxID=285268 RepID=A0A511XAR7_9PROT|nr:squalene/phytoene synthase family protein [Acetobacter nitrogenifigens]GEN60054.1 hypothetical protein ANI02nite_19380 [Acetobacter nitrogenifigens DSM 23921 = NBRC 105050]
MNAEEDAATRAARACAEIARKRDPDRFLCAMFLPPAVRSVAFPVIAFNCEIVRALHQPVSSAFAGPMAGLIRLQWWRDIVQAPERRFQARHDVAMTLGELLEEGRIQPQPLLTMLEARENELYGLPDWEGWRQAMRDGSGQMQRIVGSLLGLKDTALLERIEEAGAAYAAGALLRHLPAVLAGGRPALPSEALVAAGLDPEDRAGLAKIEPEQLALLAASLRQEGTALLPSGRDAAPRRNAGSQRHALRLASLPATLAVRDLRREPVQMGQERGLGDRLRVVVRGLLR